jgi:hypothetical protein
MQHRLLAARGPCTQAGKRWNNWLTPAVSKFKDVCSRMDVLYESGIKYQSYAISHEI